MNPNSQAAHNISQPVMPASVAGGLSAPQGASIGRHLPPRGLLRQSERRGIVNAGKSTLRARHSLGGLATQSFTLQGPGFPNLYLTPKAVMTRLTIRNHAPFTLP